MVMRMQLVMNFITAALELRCAALMGLVAVSYQHLSAFVTLAHQALPSSTGVNTWGLQIALFHLLPHVGVWLCLVWDLVLNHVTIWVALTGV